ncbi:MULTISPECIES: nitroreductase family protein [unclassified Leucobacter]|uniref:nitroreductase family protein n=1 Tax=unclassified Leucobacter TaxID=2621730 RepID=UPI001F149460|nr:nitroreductase family protein [Leucobacter sp. CX169]
MNFDEQSPQPALAAVRSRRSRSKVTDLAPTHEELAELVQAAAGVADHSKLRPWRLIELRGDARARVGEALAAAQSAPERAEERAIERQVAKTERAPLLIAIVSSPVPSLKVPLWEQEATTSGVAHVLSLLLDEAGWGVLWRTGLLTRTAEVARAHRLSPNEVLLGWLYVGGLRSDDRQRKDRSPIDLKGRLSSL